MDLGKSLRVAMAKKGIKNKDLAKELGVKPQQISNWLSGSIGKSSVESLSGHFDLKISEFIALGEEA